MDETTFRATFVLLDTYTGFGTSKEDVQKSAESMIRDNTDVSTITRSSVFCLTKRTYKNTSL
jgi:hypothetical protein